MLDFFLLILILCGAAWGSAAVFVLLKAFAIRMEGKGLEKGGGGMDTELLREELERMAGRLGRVEEELEFYKRLKTPKEEDSQTT